MSQMLFLGIGERQGMTGATASGKLVIVVINAISIQSLSLFAKYFSLAVWLSADADGFTKCFSKCRGNHMIGRTIPYLIADQVDIISYPNAKRLSTSLIRND
ncbi:hypothetical protein QQP08_003059 [Theobroma cacao]|nr:hypothetical protein QQP08_003059 [Theobroma cacao]